MLGLSVPAAYTILFVLCLPVCLWVAWTDLTKMKIKNEASLALLAIFIVAGLALIPLEFWIWRWLNAAVVFAIGYALWALKAGWGAGDVKFGAAMAPFVAQSIPDIQLALMLLAGTMLLTLALHRLFRSIPAVRRATPGWESWNRTLHVPVGVSLAATLSLYLAFKAFPSFYGWATGLLG
jgi:prepilin peptidase CpaA